MTVAYVLSGGSSLGSIQVGMALALEELGIQPDMIIGASVGSLNGAWLASGKSARDLTEVWKRLSTRKIFPLRPIVGLRGFLGHHSYLIPNTGLRHVIETNIPFRNIEDAKIPFSVIATDASNGEEVRLESGPVVDAVLASSAIPGVFPPVSINGHTLIDGGIAANAPISQAIDNGATEVWVLSTGYSCSLPEPPTSAVAMALHAIGLLVNQRFRLETELRTFPVSVHLIPAPCPIEVGPTDFSQSTELIDRAHRGTLQWVRNGEPHAIPWPLHAH
jgi:NTE family protein